MEEQLKSLISGFSKLNSDEKLELLRGVGVVDQDLSDIIKKFRHPDAKTNSLFEKLTENVITNYHLPYSIVPNFLINGKQYFVPMVTEESSVIAAASWSAKFWATKGGFKCKVIGVKKIGQIHFLWKGESNTLFNAFNLWKNELRESVSYLTENMEKRGGGITSIELINFDMELKGYYQCRVSFNTSDSMGANFINSCLETMARTLRTLVERDFTDDSLLEIIMSILSNYTPECLVECSVECSLDQLNESLFGKKDFRFAEKFKTAIDIANIDPYRAVTHNKGIYNGIDAVILATANDSRAVEASGHAYAARSGQYKSLSSIELGNDIFRFSIKVPLALGTVGGLTKTHPLAAISLKILGNPSSNELMQITAAAGMANHFSAINSLITTGIQKGHMQMHLSKILHQLQATELETSKAINHFSNKTITYRDVNQFINRLREGISQH